MRKKCSADRNGAKSSPSQSQKRRRVGSVDKNNVVGSKKRDSHDDEQVEEEPHYNYHGPRSYGSGKGTEGSAEERSITVTLSDPDVLDCPICFDSFTLPVYQCDNGHVACSACCINLGKKCATCSLPIGSNRCRALEKVLESVKIPCPHADYGCKDTLSYNKKKNHMLDCTYVPCSCPHSDCDFVASSKDLSFHFMDEHDPGESFIYDYTFSVALKSDDNEDEVIVLQEQTHGKLFILHNNVVRVGNAVSISCIGPNCNHEYAYEILAKTEGCSLELKSTTKNIQQSDVGGSSHSSRFLLIPFGYFGTSEPPQVEICIRSDDE